MVLTIARLSTIVIAAVMSVPASALDFDKEIAKQQRSVKVKYKRAPKTMAHFLHQYGKCKARRGSARSVCNNQEAKKRYNAYRLAWEERQRRNVAMSTGEFQISLEKRDRDPASVQE